MAAIDDLYRHWLCCTVGKRDVVIKGMYLTSLLVWHSALDILHSQLKSSDQTGWERIQALHAVRDCWKLNQGEARWSDKIPLQGLYKNYLRTWFSEWNKITIFFIFIFFFYKFVQKTISSEVFFLFDQADKSCQVSICLQAFNIGLHLQTTECTGYCWCWRPLVCQDITLFFLGIAVLHNHSSYSVFVFAT